MHAKPYLYDVAKLAFGETETASVETWVKAAEPFLFDGDISEVVARIRALDTAVGSFGDFRKRSAVI